MMRGKHRLALTLLVGLAFLAMGWTTAVNSSGGGGTASITNDRKCVNQTLPLSQVEAWVWKELEPLQAEQFRLKEVLQDGADPNLFHLAFVYFQRREKFRNRRWYKRKEFEVDLTLTTVTPNVVAFEDTLNVYMTANTPVGKTEAQALMDALLPAGTVTQCTGQVIQNYLANTGRVNVPSAPQERLQSLLPIPTTQWKLITNYSLTADTKVKDKQRAEHLLNTITLHLDFQ